MTNYWVKIIFLIFCVSVNSFTVNAEEEPLGPFPKDKSILLIYSYHPTFVTTPRILEGIQSVLGPYNIELDIEYMDSKRYNKPELLEQFFHYLSFKISHRAPYDVIIVSDDNALEFVKKHMDNLFQSTPIVFLGINNEDAAIELDQNPYVTGVIESVTIKETLDLAKSLNPDLRQVYAIFDSTTSGQGDLAKLDKIIPEYEDIIFKFINLGDSTWDELALQLRQIPENSVVLRLASFRDKDSVYLPHYEMISVFVNNSSVPVFALRDHDISYGSFGGKVVSFVEQGKQAALLVKKILYGTPVNTIKVIRESPNQFIFNYQALKRYGVKESDLPENSIILGKPVRLYEKYMEYIWFVLMIIVFLFVFVVFLLMEINAKKVAEKKLKLHQDHLEDMVAERTEELRNANKELESFSYSVSHDLRAPLRGIDGFSQILVDEYSCKLDSSGIELLSRVRKSAQHMSDLIDDILELSRVSRKAISKDTFNISDLANDVVAKFKLLEPERNVEVLVEQGLKVTGDRHLIEVAMNNLVDNAWKYTGKNTQANIEFGRKKVNGSEDVYYLKDNGPGFDMEYVDKLFGAFQRLHRKEDYPGTGIGLATVYRVINRHGGRVWAESELGNGATFYFTLPH